MAGQKLGAEEISLILNSIIKKKFGVNKKFFRFCKNQNGIISGNQNKTG